MPDPIVTVIGLALGYASLGRPHDALEEIEAFEAANGRTEALSQCCIEILRGLEDWKTMSARARWMLVDTSWESAYAWRVAIEAARERELFVEAVYLSGQALEWCDKDPGVLAEAARVQAIVGNFEEARRLLDRVRLVDAKVFEAMRREKCLEGFFKWSKNSKL